MFKSLHLEMYEKGIAFGERSARIYAWESTMATAGSARRFGMKARWEDQVVFG